MRKTKKTMRIETTKNYRLRKLAESMGIDIDEYNRELDEAMKRMDAGHFVTHEDALKRLAKWRKKDK